MIFPLFLISGLILTLPRLQMYPASTSLHLCCWISVTEVQNVMFLKRPSEQQCAVKKFDIIILSRRCFILSQRSRRFPSHVIFRSPSVLDQEIDSQLKTLKSLLLCSWQNIFLSRLPVECLRIVEILSKSLWKCLSMCHDNTQETQWLSLQVVTCPTPPRTTPSCHATHVPVCQVLDPVSASSDSKAVYRMCWLRAAFKAGTGAICHQLCPPASLQPCLPLRLFIQQL